MNCKQIRLLMKKTAKKKTAQNAPVPIWVYIKNYIKMSK